MLKSIEAALAEHHAEMQQIDAERERISDAWRATTRAHDEARAAWKDATVQAALDGTAYPQRPPEPDLAPLREKISDLNARAEQSRQGRSVAIAAARDAVWTEAADRVRDLQKRAAKHIAALDKLRDELQDVTNALRQVEAAENSANPNTFHPPRRRPDDTTTLIRIASSGEVGVQWVLQGELEDHRRFGVTTR